MPDAAWLAIRVLAGLAGGALVGIAAMVLLKRQVSAITGGRSRRGGVLAGMLLRLGLMGIGLAGALLWDLWCGAAFAVALVVTRRIIIARVWQGHFGDGRPRKVP